MALILSGEGIWMADSNMRIISNLQTTGLQACLHISPLVIANQGFFKGKNKFQNISFMNPCQNQEQPMKDPCEPKQNHTMSPLSLTSPPTLHTLQEPQAHTEYRFLLFSVCLFDLSTVPHPLSCLSTVSGLPHSLLLPSLRVPTSLPTSLTTLSLTFPLPTWTVVPKYLLYTDHQEFIVLALCQ